MLKREVCEDLGSGRKQIAEGNETNMARKKDRLF